jgi:hypothetical protein
VAHQSKLRRFSSWLVRHKTELLQFGWPFALLESINWLFDKGFFSFALWRWGPVWGAIIPSLLVLVFNTFVFWLYDQMKVDWLRAHALRELAEKGTKTKFEKLLTWHLMPRTTFRERVMAEIRFALLLVVVDPIIVAVYYRENHFDGVSIRDWLLLMKATVVGCLIWLLLMEPFVVFLKAAVWWFGTLGDRIF